MDERVAFSGKYNYYTYYNMKKHIYRLNYEEKRRKDAANQGVQPNYYTNYFRQRLWKDDAPESAEMRKSQK